MKSLARNFSLLLLAATTALADPAAEVTAILESIREKNHLPAMAAAVFNADGLIAQGATGVRKEGEKPRVTDDDLWHLGSDTKAITSTLLGTFVAEGKLSWDDPVIKFFPEFEKQIDPALREITLANLLSHRAGLIPNLEWSKFDTRNLQRARREAARELLTKPPASAVGNYTYSNAGFVLAGAIAEKIGGKPWEQLLRERLFNPLGMKSAGFGGVGTAGKLDEPWGHFEGSVPVARNGPEADNPPVMGPAGTLHMSVADWSKFLTDQLRGASGSKALLPPEVYQAIQSPHPQDGGYGFGWGIGRRPWAGGKTLSHNGSNTMNLAVTWLAVQKQFGILVCTNQAGFTAEKASDEAVSQLIEWHRTTQPK